MLKKIFWVVTALLFFLYCSCGEKKQEQKLKTETNVEKKDTKVYKLAIINSQDQEPYTSTKDSLLLFLKNKGYIEGKNLLILLNHVGNSEAKGLAVMKEMAEKQPDLIFIQGTVMTIAYKNSIYFNNPKYQFIFANTTDPIGIGIIENFNVPPKFNITGVCHPVQVPSRLKFVKDIIPNLKTIGIIHSEMPQSVSYNKWVEDAINNTPELKSIKVIYRSVPLVTGENGTQKMAETAKKYVRELDKKVDVFLGCNDQLCADEVYYKTIANLATKPIIGSGYKEVLLRWGVTASIFPDTTSVGEQVGQMIIDIFQGKQLKDIPAQWPKSYGFAYNESLAKKYKIIIPDLAGVKKIK